MCSYAKNVCALLVLMLALGLIGAQPARTGKRLEKQQAAAPYPTAEELKPETPFEEGVPDQTYGPPDQTYGPPPTDQVEQLPSADEPQDFTPDPEAEEVQPIDQAPARLSKQLRRQPQRLILLAERPLRLVSPQTVPLRVPVLW
ncbi:uncharacterized protein LOC111064686 [Drosophila obscura]|uniref:uncharacterized protein LOC111064686 n=1 Tax=Drosophila obscura TaxID=7282 RepID=UPI001BB2A1C2|nr:uncharacterized protein LOC111064686 [Drosophila obscura]